MSVTTSILMKKKIIEIFHKNTKEMCDPHFFRVHLVMNGDGLYLE